MATKRSTGYATEVRRCIGSQRFGIEAHEAPVSLFPKQPSRKDGLGLMCSPHWKAYVKGLREARASVQGAGAEALLAEVDALPAPEMVARGGEAIDGSAEADAA